jgi:hypothetical protein
LIEDYNMVCTTWCVYKNEIVESRFTNHKTTTIGFILVITDIGTHYSYVQTNPPFYINEEDNLLWTNRIKTYDHKTNAISYVDVYTNGF